MKKVSDVFKSIRFAKLDPHHDKGPAVSTDDEEHGAVSSQEFAQQLAHVKKRAMQEARMSAAVKLQRAFEREQQKSAASRQRAEELLNQKKEEPKKTNEEVEYLEEGRPSQRHPLEGHEYHKKTDAELEYIAKDAHAAAEAMKSHNTTAENKYRDQANDSATVRYYRKKNGMQPWYKKKYGHVNEENDMKKEDNTPPFDGPYTKAKGTITDKSGAKHTVQSRVRDLARKALQAQAAKLKPAKTVKESLEESRKAEIIKSASKSAKEKAAKTKDKFEADPVLSSEVMKEDK